MPLDQIRKVFLISVKARVKYFKNVVIICTWCLNFHLEVRGASLKGQVKMLRDQEECGSLRS